MVCVTGKGDKNLTTPKKLAIISNMKYILFLLLTISAFSTVSTSVTTSATVITTSVPKTAVLTSQKVTQKYLELPAVIALNFLYGVDFQYFTVLHKGKMVPLNEDLKHLIMKVSIAIFITGENTEEVRHDIGYLQTFKFRVAPEIEAKLGFTL